MGEFAEGLKDFFTVGAYVKPIRLNKRMKEILFLMIEDSLENTSINFKEDEESAYNSFMDSMTWLTQELSREKIHKINLNKKIALVILHWIWVNNS